LSAGFVPSGETFKAIVAGLHLDQPRRNAGVYKATGDEMNKFEFLLTVLDALERRKLSLDFETYIAIIREGVKYGGIRRKIASLLAKARSQSVLAGKKLSGESAEIRVENAGLSWVHLLKNYSLFKENVDRTNLPTVRIRCNDRQLRKVLITEQSLTVRSRIKYN